MASPSRKRKLQLEPLELRALLDGNLTVSILQGSLVLQGDSAGNVASIEQLPAVDASGAVVEGGSFQIVPDENTSINQGKPGEALTVSGVTGGVLIDLGAGDDRLKFSGVRGQTVSSLKIDAGAGADAVSLSNLDVAGALTIESRDSLDASASQTRALDCHLKFEQLRGKRSSADLSGMQITHKLDIESVGAADVSVSQSSAASVFMKFEGIKGEAAVDTASLDGVTVDGGLSVTSRNAALKFDGTDVQAGIAHIKYDGSGVQRSSVDLRGVHVVHKLDIEGSGGADVSVRSSDADHMFLKFEGKLKGQAAASTASLDGVTVDGGLTIASRDAALKLEATDASAADFYLKLDQPRGQRSSADLTGVQVTHKLDIEGRGGADVSVAKSNAASVYLKFEGIKGEAALDTASLDGVTVDGGLTVTSRDAALKFEGAGLQAGNIYIKYEGASDQRSSASISGSQIQHKLDVASNGPLDFSVQKSSAHGIFLKVEFPRRQDARSTVSLSDVDLDGELDVMSLAPLDFSASALRAVDMFLKITDIKMQQAGSTVSLVDVVLSGGLQISTGNGNDTVIISGSSVEGPVKLDGGRGQDSLTLVDDQIAVEPIVVGFESSGQKPT
jgi:hypothetical protein